MGTVKQKRLARVIVENAGVDAPLQKGEMLAKVGYSKTVAKTKPEEIIQSEGVQEELDLLGFTETNAMNVVQEIMNNEDAQDHNRLKATELVFKVKGTFAPEKKAVLNVSVKATNEQTQQIADEYEEKLKGKFNV